MSEVTGSIESFKAEADSEMDRAAIADLTSDLDGWARANDEVARLVSAGKAAEAAQVAKKNGDTYKAKSRAATDDLALD